MIDVGEGWSCDFGQRLYFGEHPCNRHLKKAGCAVLLWQEVFMAFLSRVLWLGVAVAFLALGGWAQGGPNATPSIAEKNAREWLHSGEPRLVAWGAHEALVSRNPYLVPDLLFLANQWQPLLPRERCDWACGDLTAEQKDQRLGMIAVLDALIQMNVAVPADSLRNLAPDFGNAVAIFLARMPSDESAPLSMQFYRDMASVNSYSLQYVSAALLALHPSGEFATDLLSNTTVQARVVIMQPNADGVGFGSGGSGYFSGGNPREDWPKIGQYRMRKEKEDGDFVVVGGIDPIYARRQEANYCLDNDCNMAFGVALGPEERRRLVAEMLGVKPEEIAWETFVETTIEYRSMEQFHTALLAFVEQQEQKYRETAEALAERELFEESEVLHSLPRLELRFVDMRGEGSEAFPKEMGLPERVSWAPWP
jgi:hypothetical protein